MFSVILLANLACDESKVPKIESSLQSLAQAAEKRGHRLIFVASLLKDIKSSDADSLAQENLAEFNLMAKNHGVKFFSLSKSDSKQDLDTIRDFKACLLQTAKEWQAKKIELK